MPSGTSQIVFFQLWEFINFGMFAQIGATWR